MIPLTSSHPNFDPNDADTGEIATVDMLQTAIIRLDKQARITAMNSASEYLFSRSIRVVYQQGLNQLLVNSKPILAMLERAELIGSLVEHSMELDLWDDHTQVFHCCVTWLQDEGYLLEMFPINNLMEHFKNEAIHKQRTILDEFLRSIAHEVKNPLGGMRGATQLLKRQLKPDQYAYADVILTEIDRLNKLVERFQHKPSSKEKQVFNIHEILEHVVTLVDAEFKGQLKFDRDYDPSIPSFLVFKDSLIQALLNLLRNASQAHANHIKIETRITMDTPLKNNTVFPVIKVRITDNGRGIPDKIKENLFMPMITGRADGTGIGLSLVQEIAHQHGGIVDCSSKPGKTRFNLFLPMEASHEA